jgi:hypothetical protein
MVIMNLNPTTWFQHPSHSIWKQNHIGIGTLLVHSKNDTQPCFHLSRVHFVMIVHHQHTFSSILFYEMSMSIKLEPSLMCIVQNSMSPIDVSFVKNKISTDLRIQLKLPYPSITCLLGCVCTHPIDPLGIHLLWCSHGLNALGHITQFLTSWHPFKEVGFHVVQEQLHILPSTMLQTSKQCVNIVLFKYEVQTLVDIFITIPPMQIFWLTHDLPRMTLEIAQTKEKGYQNHHLGHHFLQL